MIVIILSLLAIPFVILGCALLTRAAGLPPTLQALTTGAVMLVYLIGLGAYVVGRLLRSGRRLDAAMADAGLSYDRREGAACRYRGTVREHECSTLVAPAYRFQPWRLDISVATGGGCRIALGSRRPLLDCRGAKRLLLDGPLADVHIHPDDPEEARKWLANSGAARTVHELVDRLAEARSWELYIQPDRVWLRARAYRLTDATVAAWLNAMVDLADAFEQRAPALPQVTP
jgi:hypothetical protein